MKILVIGGTGKVGTHLVARLQTHGVMVRVLSASLERAAAIPNVEPAAANITGDVDGARSAFEGVDAVFMLNRPSLSEMPEGLLAVELARGAGVRRFIYQSVHNAEKMDYIPHVAAKLAIERGVVASGMDWTFLRPNYFFQNDLTGQSDLVRGRFTAPIGSLGVAAVDARDIADAAAKCLVEEGHEGKSYNLVGPDTLTGEICAATWASVTGRDFVYDGDVARWREATRAFMPPWFNFDLAMMYRHLNARGMLPERNDVDVVTALLGRRPRAYRDYVVEQAKEWGLLV